MKTSHLFALILTSLSLRGQSKEEIVALFQKQHDSLVSQPCSSGQLINKRSMNLFMADRIGYYLGSDEQLSYCKNNLGLNTATGILSLTHSLFEPSGQDEALRKFKAIGLRVNAFDSFDALKNGQKFSNELGFTVKNYWLKEPKISLKNCEQKTASNLSSAILLAKTIGKIDQKSKDFELDLALNGQENEAIKKDLRQRFYKNLQEEYSRKIAEGQMRDLFQTMRFSKISMHWTNLAAYVPVMYKRLSRIETSSGLSQKLTAYPLEVALNHTRFIETGNASKYFWISRLGITVNNSIDAKILGEPKEFLNPKIYSQFTYFPPENHFGLSVGIEQNFGRFKDTNGRIGIPVVLIDKQSFAASNFEIQINFPDLGNSAGIRNSLKDRIYLAVVFGQPIGRNVY